MSGAHLRYLRRRAGMTQGELASRAGVRLHTIHHIEVDHRFPQAHTIHGIANALGMKFHQVFDVLEKDR